MSTNSNPAPKVEPSDEFPVDLPESSSSSQVATVGVGASERKCAICGDVAYTRNFRVLSCRACAAFFRRSVALKRQYTCSRNDDCNIRASRNSRTLCRFCRFMKCVQMGMEISAIVEREPDEFRCFSADSPIRKLLIAQRATFVNRYASQLRACAGNHALIRMGSEQQRFVNHVTVGAEFPVLLEFLVASGIEECGLEPRQTTCPDLYDYRLAARATIDCCNENITSAARLHGLRMDNVEHACMFQIHALSTAIRLFPDRWELRRLLDQILEQLKDHYRRNYDDVAVKLGTLVLTTSQMSHWSDFLQEYVTLLQLTGYDPFMKRSQHVVN
ncbi:Nuclear receptor domain-containing protein [Aphelenchoides fujianensis]|nr:Nuclear receptor domain-containing protein [Aphelenchoides fujianensis]